jgi:hypothetical protein
MAALVLSSAAVLTAIGPAGALAWSDGAFPPESATDPPVFWLGVGIGGGTVNENEFKAYGVEGTGLTYHLGIGLRVLGWSYLTGRVQYLTVGRQTNVALQYATLSLGVRSYLPRVSGLPALFAEAGVARMDIFDQPYGFSIREATGWQAAVGAQWGLKDKPPLAFEVSLDHSRGGSDPVMGGTTLRIGVTFVERKSEKERDRDREGWEPRRSPGSDGS